ncbi:DNA ligase D [Flavobacterium sp. NST-5]|uniref:DNA ligase (ATP) n=1 Tax=Flavobacterium ichthyis TaxID=2698827 RepID=A0ABW9Z6H5_9FLAO|nr:DNA ligase D [Flavobacterium ichthyis]NBL64177.1 DNA ligase D [Flavobacterium ichthyis]
MALEKYNQKRDFTKTKEPKGVKKTSRGKLTFVIQKHAASSLHYDFRLEIDGVLVSWAVPKGPSANPSDKRLAVHVEDHPMDYFDFEGTIPKGEYGGGTVMVWDYGTYRPENAEGKISQDNSLMEKQLKDGSIKIILKGKKLNGAWHLVEMKGKENMWLLMKAKDEFAETKMNFDETSAISGLDFKGIEANGNIYSSKNGKKLSSAEAKKVIDSEKSSSKKNKAETQKVDDIFTREDLAEAKKIKKFPSNWRPQLATLAEEPFDHDDWIFENKFDGYRSFAQIENGKVNLISRNGNSFNKKYAVLVETFSTIKDDIILDGEIVVEDTNGTSKFQWLQHFDEHPKKGNLKFYVFDILYFNQYDLRALTLLQRKKILKAILPKLKNISISEHTIGKGIETFQAIEKLGGEGIIAKKINSKYHESLRSKDWLKIKATKQQEMVIGGFTEPSGSRNSFGALLIGYYQDKKLLFSGKVGSGFSDEVLKNLHSKLKKIKRKTSPFANDVDLKDVHWVSPKLVAQIKFSEKTDSGSLRHPVFLGLRTDKKPKDVIWETEENTDEIVADKISAKAKKKERKTTDFPESKVEFTNHHKIFWPKEKYTKGDVIQYYNEIAEYILPYLKDRPQSLLRTPNGIKKPGFFQKNVEGQVPNWVKTRKLKSKSTGENITYLICQDRDTLLFLANWGCIELNPWSSRLGNLNHPDYIIFDLDPHEADIKKLVRTALTLKEILDTLQVPAYVKTSGGKGLHVFIPILQKYSYNNTREFSQIVSQMVLKKLPEIVSLERSPSKRKGKIYLDFLQNGKGKTMASIYSLRPRDGANVSTPLEWEEINNNLNLSKFNIKTISKRLAEKGDLWENFFNDAVDLKKLLEKI